MVYPMFSLHLPFSVKSSGNTLIFMPRGVFSWCFLISSRWYWWWTITSPDIPSTAYGELNSDNFGRQWLSSWCLRWKPGLGLDSNYSKLSLVPFTAQCPLQLLCPNDLDSNWLPLCPLSIQASLHPPWGCCNSILADVHISPRSLQPNYLDPGLFYT